MSNALVFAAIVLAALLVTWVLIRWAETDRRADDDG